MSEANQWYTETKHSALSHFGAALKTVSIGLITRLTQKARLYHLPNIAKKVAAGLSQRKKMIIKLLKKLKRVKMTDYDLGMLHGSEGREPQKNSKLYLMGYNLCKSRSGRLPT